MPELTTASAISRINLSLTSQPNLFQLFHPIGGVGAILTDCASAVRGEMTPPRRRIVPSTNTPAPPCAHVFLTALSFISPPICGADCTAQETSHLSASRWHSQFRLL